MRVVLLKIENYQRDILYQRIDEALDKYFPLESFFSLGDKILLKPNLLMSARAEEAITTHPAFVFSVAKIFKERGYNMFLADSPGGFLDNDTLRQVYKETGMLNLSQELNVRLLYPKKVFVRGGISLCWWAKDFKIVNLPKLKTHEIMVLTLATKNLYGCISGKQKSFLHCQYPKAEDFARILLWLYEELKPPLNIIDGIISLEGNGPARKGKPKGLGLVGLSNDALALDYAISNLLSLDLKKNPLLNLASQKGLLSSIELISDFSHPIKDFQFPSTHFTYYLPSFLAVLVKRLLRFFPGINPEECIRCLRCIEACPAQAISLKGGAMVFDYRRCIFCMCCAELCPQGAVSLRKSPFLKILEWIFKNGKSKDYK